MKRKTEQFIQPSEELRKLPHKSVCYDDSLLRLNNNKKYKEGVKEFKKCDNKKFPGLVSPHLPKIHLNFAHNYVAITFTKLLRIYYLFILPLMATMALGNHNLENSTLASNGTTDYQGVQAAGDPMQSINSIITPLCNLFDGGDKFCKDYSHIITPIAFFLISTFISIIVGLIRRCCCGIGRSRRRRKRNAQMNEMDEEQMLQAQLLQQQMQQQQLQQLQMQQMLQMGQQLPFVGMLQETPIPDEGKKKKKKSKKQQDDSMNPFYLGYQPVVQ
ncbi:hypothetical protein PVP01_0903500 [Plasmodium vivax]|uniref:Uncharacterized protein n=1 Tax=Plasmodium vivax TaxID=5855 RepID=A0A564ZWF7_PLAVI|nr:hypothetical protein PVP01_0903500 [Plasmodium vivax]